MAEYRQIEYRIGNDGSVIETVLNASGASCVETTAEIEQALGMVNSRELLPQYYETQDDIYDCEVIDNSQTTQQ